MSERGEKGERGETGARGAPGKDAPKPSWWKRHKALIGYLVLVAVAVVSVSQYQVRTNRELNRRDAQSCAQRNRLASNQRIVIGALAHVLAIEVAEQKHTPLREELQIQLADLRLRYPHTGPEAC